MTVLETIIQSLKNLGGKAKYLEIYQEYEYISQCKLTSGQKAGIRKCIEDHSSDSENFKGDDIFYSVEGKGKGVWGLK
ncbi:MAG: hypothetical protein IKB04_01120 [Clostridia bacterium]|nr:hypothetical protein [Clostridia bacterium]